ncbi:MAG TPA: 6-carboxytetrahydropterin synthase [Bacteroidales bacterium]|jgi:6-pyruvoyltetrahydropterin/6-carboxytetrahydropterin synthase|nr:6-carboxytetrahydropterin synthase [Bacteroidales bacterium]HNZ43418.1 6-carboxytetrahydropterin synthase [Bacteroidales bacterium]HOH83200.1 6-carboxytetrahydropterin synthase [Bacteroidales bacterium]HPB25761.1 6-carboxytetrahydropterin synthase [Bacteroidales bacterium]HQN16607.1 6-carboxytetrahydropterin synthase [Bacteroidales bacterium]
MVFLTRRETFNAAHRLFREDFSDEKNLEIFGKCSNPNWHGHNYELFVTVCGDTDPQTGMIINLKTLSELIRLHIIDKIDHKNMNLEVGFMKGRMASTENLAVAIWEQLSGTVAKHHARLHCVKICETENNYVEYYGE